MVEMPTFVPQKKSFMEERVFKRNVKCVLAVFFAVMLFPLQAFAQQPQTVSAEGEVFELVEKNPEYPGGREKLMAFLSSNLRYPQTALQMKLSGRIIVQFVVNKDGDIMEGKVLSKKVLSAPQIKEDTAAADAPGVYQRDYDLAWNSLEEEALRVVGIMPKWIPGEQRGKPVNVKCCLPITFRLNP